MTGVSRIGLITPSSNTVVEPTSQALLRDRDDVAVHATRLRVTRIDVDDASLSQFDLVPLQAAAELLADAGMSATAWAGTAGAWAGEESDRRAIEAISRAAGSPATTSYVALLELLRRAGLRRIGLWTPYVDRVQARIVGVLADSGVEVVAETHLGITENARFAEVGEGAVVDGLRDVAVPDAQAVVVLCTNVGAARVADRLEPELGVPVLDSLAVTLWHALELAGALEPSAVLGRRGAALA